MSEAVDNARADLIAALVRAGDLIIGNLDGATLDSRAEAARALVDARFRGIVLNELLAQEDGADPAGPC
jgi:hypothetical protein